ncbi:MAG TPA: 50S ribosomal protein L30 [Thermoanaerobaculia bacterium]|jgi:large subunit ribosomal protein L30
MAAKKKNVRIRQVRSAIGTKPQHREVLRGLGLRGIRHEIVREDSAAIRGMVNQVSHLVELVEV